MKDAILFLLATIATNWINNFMPEFRWNYWPPKTPLHTVECDMILPFGRVYCAKLNGADFVPNGFSKVRTKDGVENEMYRKFLRMIGAA